MHSTHHSPATQGVQPKWYSCLRCGAFFSFTHIPILRRDFCDGCRHKAGHGSAAALVRQAAGWTRSVVEGVGERVKKRIFLTLALTLRANSALGLVHSWSEPVTCPQNSDAKKKKKKSCMHRYMVPARRSLRPHKGMFSCVVACCHVHYLSSLST